MSKNIKMRVQNFYRRWNIEYDEQRRVLEFKNRILSTIEEILGKIFLSDKDLLRNYMKLVGESYVDTEFSPIGSAISVLTIRKFEDSPVYKLILNETEFNRIILYIQCLFWLDIGTNQKEKLYEKLKLDIDLSLLDIKIKKIKDGEYLLYPAGAKLLDEKVINDVLDWLVDYPESYKLFESALRKYNTHGEERNLLDDLRLSLELLLRQILNNKKSLENQKNDLGKYLDGKGISKEAINIYTQLISSYSAYQNEHIKHNYKPDTEIKKSEVEFLIYLTGTFMRFLLETTREPQKNNKGFSSNNSKEK
jgi:hypothetical protein